MGVFFCNLFRKQYIVPCSYCILFAPFAQGVIRFLKVRQCWSNLWADLVINLMRCQSYDEDGETWDGNWSMTWLGGPDSSIFRSRAIRIFEAETLKKIGEVSIVRSRETRCHTLLTRWAAGLSIFGLSSDQPPVVGVVMSYFPGMVVKTQEHKESNSCEKLDPVGSTVPYRLTDCLTDRLWKIALLSSL